MKKLYIITLFTAAISFAPAQNPEWKDVASIFFNRCTSCHHPGGNPQPIYTTYTQTYPWVASIQSDLNNNIMPPWPPDTTYTRFQHERIITPAEKAAILNWINTGATKGDTTLAPPAPTYPQYQLFGTPTMILQIPTFTSNASSQDAYNCFAIPSGLTQDRILRAYEIVPGNMNIVHHVVVNVDTTGTVSSDLSGNCYTEPGQFSIGGYAPGSAPTIFPGYAPLKAGIRIKAGSKIILQIHYPVGTAGQVDSTKIRMYFYPVNATGIRPIYVTVPLQNWTMWIPANTSATYTAKYPSGNNTLPLALSMYATFPHSHKICTKITNYAYRTSPPDTIPLVRINRWDFNWQGYYIYHKLVKVPNGYKLFSTHFYDNTTNNPNNPNPQLVSAGTSTTDEMLFDGFQYLLYQAGDENLNLDSIIAIDSLLNPQTGYQEYNLGALHPYVYPNPFNSNVNIAYSLENSAQVSVSVYNMYGTLVRTIGNRNESSGPHNVMWDGTNDNSAEVPAGVYFYRITAGTQSASGKLMLMKK